MTTDRAVRVLAIVVCCAGLLTASGAAAQAGARDGVRVARGAFAGRTWSVSIAGRGGHRCYELRLNGKQVSGITGTCRADNPVESIWKPLFGISDLNDSATVVLALTSTRVRSLRLLTGHPHSTRPDNWIRIGTRRISRGQAHRAQVKRNFRFVAPHSLGTLCVKKAVAFNRKGERIDKLEGPCEY